LEYKTAWTTHKAAAAIAAAAAIRAAAIAEAAIEGREVVEVEEQREIGGGQLVVNPPPGAIIAVAGAQVVQPTNMVTCPKGTNCDHVFLQGNIFITEQLADVVKKCKKDKPTIKTVLVNVRGSKTTAELCRIVSFLQQCGSEKAFTGVVLLPDGTTGDTMKTPLVNLLKAFGKVTCIAVVATSPMEILEVQEPKQAGHKEFTSTLTSVIQWAVVVRFDESGDRLYIPKRTFDMLMFPSLSPQLKFKFQQGSISSNSAETAIVDPDQLNPALLAYIW
jgi:hypothetical protein